MEIVWSGLLRAEITCLVILAFLSFYYGTSKLKERGQSFFTVLAIAIIHVIFSCVTIYTVNNLGTVPELVNRVCHLIFYASGLLMSYVFYIRVLRSCGLYKSYHVLERVSRVPLFTYFVMACFLPVNYVEGITTNYSSGFLLLTTYLLFLFYSLSSCLTLLVFRKRVDDRVFMALFPMSLVLCFAVFIQAFWTELLITPGCVTFMCLGLFIALDNPDKKYKEQALWDYLTGLRNQNSYTRDLLGITEYYTRRSTHYLGIVVADINNLKKVNDTLGHIEGNTLISTAAHILQDNLKSADALYRIGGDEFVAIYRTPNAGVIQAEVAAVHTACADVMISEFPVQIALGFCVSSVFESGSVAQIFDAADKRMYENKRLLKCLVEV